MRAMKLFACGLLAVLLFCAAPACTIIINQPGPEASSPASVPEPAESPAASGAESAPDGSGSEEPSVPEPADVFAADNDEAKEKISAFLSSCDYVFVLKGKTEGNVYRNAVRKEDDRYYGARYSAEDGKTCEVYTRGSEVLYNERAKFVELPSFSPVTDADRADEISYNALKQFSEVFLKRAVENAEDANTLLAASGEWKKLNVQQEGGDTGTPDPAYFKISYDGLTLGVYLESGQIRRIEYEVSGENGVAYYAEFKQAKGDLYSPTYEDRNVTVPDGRAQAFFDDMYNALAPVRPAKG